MEAFKNDIHFGRGGFQPPRLAAAGSRRYTKLELIVECPPM